MLALQINDLKLATNKLFLEDAFDYFLIHEVSISTFASFQFDGHLKKSYFSDEELEELRDKNWCTWKMLRPTCYALIKGHKLPGQFKLVFSLSADNIEKFLLQYHLEDFTNSVQSLYLNFKYEQQTLQVFSGISLSIFTLDKTIEQAWDDMVKKILKHHEISFQEH